MTTDAPKKVLDQSKAQGKAKMGLDWQSKLAMWVIVLTLCIVALPKHIFQSSNTTSQNFVSGSTHTASTAFTTQTLSVSTTAPTDQVRAVADIAKYTIDHSKDKYDAIKDTYDKLFSVLAAMAALLVFLGFKGLDSFVSARDKATQSELSAQNAKSQIEAAEKKMQTFIEEVYPKNNRAEMNVAQGIALREIAAVHNQILELQAGTKDAELGEKARQQYFSYLEKSLYYLDAAMKDSKGMDEQLIRRALGIKCNVLRRMDRLNEALSVAEEIIQKFGDKDESAYYNAACYCTVIASKSAADERSKTSEKAISYLKKAIELESANKAEAGSDSDFNWLREDKTQAETFKKLISTP
jgi:hypothetical protein